MFENIFLQDPPQYIHKNEYVAIFQIGGTRPSLDWLEFQATDWNDALRVWEEKKPAGAELRLISDRRRFDWQIVSGYADINIGIV